MDRLQIGFGLLLLAPFIASATMQKGSPIRSLALHWPAALLAGFAVAYPVSLYLRDFSIPVGFVVFFVTYYFLDAPFRAFVQKFRRKKEKKKK